MRNAIAIVLLSAFFPIVANGQFCNNFHRKNCKPSTNGGEEFFYNGQSKSAMFEKGQTSELKFIAYKGQDYRVTICTEEALGNQVHFKIKDGRSGEVLYDNASEEMIQDFEFSSENTRPLALEVTVPSGETKEEKFKPTDMACLGVLIEHRPSTKTGF